jgi:hypothetical protein
MVELIGLKEKVMIEEITVSIGNNGSRSANNDYIKRTEGQDIQYLMKVLEISYKRAQGLIHKLCVQRNCCTRKINVVLTYRQLAKYVIQRNIDGLASYWRYPTVLEYTPECHDDKMCQSPRPIELRPNYRSKHNHGTC